VFAPLAPRVSLATMAEVKKNFCDDLIAVRQLVSHIHLAGTASACQRKLLVESSVGWLSRISRRKSPFRFTTFFLAYFLPSTFSNFSVLWTSVSARSAAVQNCFQNGLGRSDEFFMSEKLPNYCPEAVRRLRDLLGLS